MLKGRAAKTMPRKAVKSEQSANENTAGCGNYDNSHTHVRL